MDRILVFFAAVVPGLLILLYGATKTRADWRSEALWKAFMMGGVAAIACIPVELALSYLIKIGDLSPTVTAFCKALFVAAIPEECAKFLMLIGVAERDVDARRKQDILLLALCVSLGFATLENLFYIGTESEWYFVAAARSVTAVPGHGIDGLVMGALLTAARWRPQQFPIVFALLVPITLHAAYDFPLFVLRNGVQLWAVMAWFVVLVLSAIVTIYFCNKFLPVAAAADRWSGVDLRTGTSPGSLGIGIILVVAGPAIAATTIFTKFNEFAWVAPVVAILPLALGGDLLWLAWRQRRR